jgi:hypothetical protein
MHLSNNSAIWSDRVGAAFGVGNLVKCAGKELEPYLANIIPRIYRLHHSLAPRPPPPAPLAHLDF